MADNIDHDQLIGEFCDLTGASPADAQQFLAANRWDLSGAAAEFYTSQEEGIEGATEGADDPQDRSAYTGPRTLDGRPAPESSLGEASSSRSAPPPKRGGIATLGSLGQGAHHGHDDDDSDEENYKPGEEPRDLFAGGEKSGLAVQDPSSRSDPRKVVDDILKRARANASRPEAAGGEPSSAPPSRFRGSGMTLGSDDTPSQLVPDPHGETTPPAPTPTRYLHLWEDGFSVEDGPLYRFDDPQNAADLQMIRSGRAPLRLMGVRSDQPVDVQLIKHDDKYKAPPKAYKPFSGSGQRLGSPVPGTPGSSTDTASSTPAPASASVSTPSDAHEITIDAGQPTVSLRIQLANGTRLPARFNTTHTIGDVYNFIIRSSPDAGARDWVLATTFPSKDHIDKSLALGDVPEFAKGGTAVQKWT